MKKYITIIVSFFFYTGLLAQTDRAKLNTEIKKLSGEWGNGFRTIKGAIKSDGEAETIYHSRLKITGSRDSSNLIHYIKDREIWSFTTDFDKEKMSAAMLDSVIMEISFSFGKVKRTSSNIAWGYGYVPDNKKGASEKLRCFYLLVFDRGKDPLDKTGGTLSLTVSDDDYFRGR